MHKILAYGTLRKGDYNFDRIAASFGPDSIQKVGSTKVQGFQMFNLGPYPAITTGGNKDEIVCDILHVSDKAKKFIDMMELGAGYGTRDIGISGEPHTIYVHESRLEGYPRISSGDWMNR